MEGHAQRKEMELCLKQTAPMLSLYLECFRTGICLLQGIIAVLTLPDSFVGWNYHPVEEAIFLLSKETEVMDSQRVMLN